MVNMQRMRVHMQEGLPNVVGICDSAAWPVLIYIANLEVLKIQPVRLAIALIANLQQKADALMVHPVNPPFLDLRYLL
jgi:hypothetical protein